MTIVELLEKAFYEGTKYEATFSEAFSFNEFLKENEKQI